MEEASCCDNKMVAYCNKVQKLKERFDGLELHHILRQDNLVVDSLAKITSSRGPTPPGVFINDTHEPSVRALWSHDQMMSVAGKAKPTLPVEHHPHPEAMSPLGLMAISGGSLRKNLLDDLTEAQHLARRYKSYMIIGNILYKRSTSGIL